MNSPQTGAANPPPVARSTMETGSSMPNHTAAAKSGVKPMNQTLPPSFVVPVLPAAGTSRGNPATNRIPVNPVPWTTTSSSIDTASRATSGSSSRVRSGCGSHRTSPPAPSTRAMGKGRTRMPMLASVEYASSIWMGTTSAAPIADDG